MLKTILKTLICSSALVSVICALNTVPAQAGGPKFTSSTNKKTTFKVPLGISRNSYLVKAIRNKGKNLYFAGEQYRRAPPLPSPEPPIFPHSK